MFKFQIIAFLNEWGIAIVTIIVLSALMYFALGCEAETESLITPDVKVTRDQLNSEMQYLLSIGKTRIADLDRQDKIRDMIFNQTIIAAESGSVNPAGLITSLLAVLGVFSTADDVRVRKKFKKLVD